jgi:hypothetical protein
MPGPGSTFGTTSGIPPDQGVQSNAGDGLGLLAWYLGPSGHLVVHAGAAVPTTFMVV